MLIYLIYLLFSIISSYNLLPRHRPQTAVYIHIEKFNEKYNLLHIGISFNSLCKNIRYDYRSFNDDHSYITENHILRKNIIEPLIFDTNITYSKKILWGISNKTFDEIILYEKTLHKKYILGIYDCRHYVRNFTTWCLDKPTPIWRLNKLWDIL
jgi:hypothetical protein